MRGIRLAGLVVCVVTFFGAPDAGGLTAADAPAKAEAKPDPHADALQKKGLARSGGAIVLAEEAEVLEGMKELRGARKQADREALLRKKAEDKVAANQKFIKDGTREFRDLEKRLPKIKDVTAHNRTVTRMNALVTKVKEAIESQKDLEEEANKVPVEGQTRFVDGLMELAPKVDALAAKYKTAAAEAAVKSVVDKVNAGAGTKVKAGPSPEFAMAVDEVGKWRSQVDSEAIPLRAEGGIHSVDVLVNGERVRMIVDTGASHVVLPHEVAQKLNMTPGENDPTVQMKLANGAIIDGKLMTLKSVRVGRFTVDNTSCIVLQEGLSDPPTILGMSYLSHFVVKLGRGELHLTEVTEGKKPAAAPGK
jgi:clan AA aspartic protease (TIGR02281 family)